MTTPVDLPGYGRIHLRRTTKAALIELWTDVLSRSEITPEFGISLEAVTRDGDVLVARTSAGPIRARRVLLATGRRGRPRQLGVAGEDLAHVHHHLDDPVDHGGSRVLVIGGGDVAVEAALALAERPGTDVTLCHRGERFDRVKPALQERLAVAEAAGLHVLRAAIVEQFAPGAATIATGEETRAIEIDNAFVLIGSDLPTDMLAASGVRVQTHYGDVPVNRS
jgi:thioredoxin reductase